MQPHHWTPDDVETNRPSPGIVYFPQWRPDPESPALPDPERFTGYVVVGQRR